MAVLAFDQYLPGARVDSSESQGWVLSGFLNNLCSTAG